MIHFNSIGMSFLTASDRASIVAGNDPGDDGSGRRFDVLDRTRLVCYVPTEIEPLELGWFAHDDIGAPDVAADEIYATDPDEELAQENAELRAKVTEHAETIDRVIAQRDAAIAEAAELRAMVAAATAPDAPPAPAESEDLITPD